jgi:hypothetical protein
VNRREAMRGIAAILVMPFSRKAEEDSTRPLDSFMKALEAFQRNPKLANSFRANDEPIIAALTGPERGRIRAQKSTRTVSPRASDLIIASEVSSRRAYEQHYDRPVWPKGASGITIGIGYDLGGATAADLTEDWGAYLDGRSLKILSQACGYSAGKAARLLTHLDPIRIPWDVALAQYERETLPRYIGETERALANTTGLGPDSLGALVSLVYNRGLSFRDPDPRFQEMRDLSGHMQHSEFQSVPTDIRKMERLWTGQPDFKGVVLRREAEAALFEVGLRG